MLAVTDGQRVLKHIDLPVPAVHRLPLRFKRIAQKQMALRAFDAHQCSLYRVLRRKLLAGNQARALNRGVTANHLGRERQGELIQAASTVLYRECLVKMNSAAGRYSGTSLARLTLDKIAVVGRHQGFVVGMPPDVAGDKRAERDHCKVLCPRLVQRRPHQLARDALAFQFARHFGVDKEDRIPSAPILGQGDMLIDVGFPALGALVVFDIQVAHLSVCHCCLSSGGSNWSSAPAIRRTPLPRLTIVR